MDNPYLKYGIREHKKIVLNKLEGKDFESILEVGCQWGENLVAIREKFPDKRIVGIDLDWDGILDEAKTITGLDLRIGDVFKLPFKDNEFDIVFTNALFCMLPDKDVVRGLKEIIRVAKKRVILIEFEIANITGALTVTSNSGDSRTGANWLSLFEQQGLKATKEKIPDGVWDSTTWTRYGYIIEVNLI